MDRRLPGERPAKRLKRMDAVEVPPHPNGIKPLGNAYMADFNLRNSEFAGLFRFISDEVLMHILQQLDAASLWNFGRTSKCMYAFSSHDDLWKTLLVESNKHADLKWRGTWKETLLNARTECRIQVKNLFSDILYRPVYCALHPISPFIRDIPAENTITRIPTITPEEFLKDYANRPFILTKVVTEWAAFKDWNLARFVQEHSSVKFRAECVDWTLGTYYEYMKNCTYDESPLYLFDKNFIENTNLGDRFTVPEIFQEDFFDLLGDDRPDRRWLIIGPGRSGSTFHKDPNATSAWNAVLQGEKYWIMFPPTVHSPPGVFVSEDQSEVTSPESIMEWLLGFHSEARRAAGCLEGICRAGEVIYVPSGWWHLVINILDSVAITQNFVSRAHLDKTVSFMRNQPQSVSGFSKTITDPYALFESKLQEKHGDLLDKILASKAQKASNKGKQWDSMVKEAQGMGGFAFQFTEEDSDGDDNSPEEEAE